MTEPDDHELLAEYARSASETAFSTLVARYVNLVYSAALRYTGNPHHAEEIAQAVFVTLAHKAGGLQRGVVLAGWLYQTARLTAANFVKGEIRRQQREQEAYMQSTLNEPETADWQQIAPLLDEAMGGLGEIDRNAVVLRYFENKTAEEVGAALRLNPPAAHKRVARAVDKLRKFFTKRNVTIGTSGLVGLISANAVQAAPVGLAATVSAAAVLSGTVISTSTIITAATTAIAMTTLQKTIVAAALAAAVGTGIYAIHQGAQLRGRIQSLEEQQAPLAAQIQQLQRERDAATNRLAALTEELANVKKNPAELLKLRGEVGALRQEKAIAGGKSAISKITADPAARKALRDQQKIGMTVLYSDLAKRLSLTPDQTGQLNDLLADHVMESIDLITQALHDKDTHGQIDQLFAAQDSALQNQLQTLLGPDGLAQYLDYTKNLGSTLTAAQFAGSLTGDPAAVADKKGQLLQAMQEATQSALSAAGLPADYQTVPMLNFANIASEEQATQSLQLLDTIYAQVAARAGTFLNADELNKFQAYRTSAIQNSQTMLLMNRNLMAPISQ
jgi:RNA polymerase sigma factor (sigma-70 family)